MFIIDDSSEARLGTRFFPIWIKFILLLFTLYTLYYRSFAFSFFFFFFLVDKIGIVLLKMSFQKSLVLGF